MHVIDETTSNDIVFPPGQARGLEIESPGYGSAEGYIGYATPFPTDLIIPESEWVPRIREREARKSTLYHLAYEKGGVTIKNQGSLPYCWQFATTSCLEVQRAVQGQPHVSLSPGSTGAWVTGFRSRGGFGREALAGLRQHGAVPSDRWPDASISRSHDTPANKEVAQRYKADEFWFVSGWPAVVSCLLRGIPVSGGFNWWRHQVLLFDAVILDGVVCPRIANSWGQSWAEQGFSTLQGRRRIPDDAVSIRSALPS